MTLSTPDPQVTVASRIAMLLSNLAPATALEYEVGSWRTALSAVEMLNESQPLRKALQDFFERGDGAFHDEITTWLPHKRKKLSIQPQSTPIRKHLGE